MYYVCYVNFDVTVTRITSKFITMKSLNRIAYVQLLNSCKENSNFWGIRIGGKGSVVKEGKKVFEKGNSHILQLALLHLNVLI